MIRVTIELVSAITGRTETIGVALIANDGTGNRNTGSYDATLFKRNVKAPRWQHRTSGAAWKRARVESFPRLRLGPWDLLFRVLADAVGDRNHKTGLQACRVNAEYDRGAP